MMSISNEIRYPTLDAPRSPVSISTDSSRRGSLKQVLPEKYSEPPTPNSPSTRLTRKRAASLNFDNANDPRIGDLALQSASLNGPSISDPTREQVCLCQPDPKIPRPRNAFILYRQHYQAQVVAQHPGLANPEISKIIGEQWREQAPEVKSDWKRLAEEEKQRHQRQYPGYRYQPRRAGKPNGIRPTSSSSAEDPGRCPKCNGRYISTPSTPSTPFTPAFGGPRPERNLPPFTTARTTELRPSSNMQNSRMDTPRGASLHQQSYRRPQYPPPQPLQTHRERDDEMDIMSPSPGQKRRRFNEDNQKSYAANSPVHYSGPQQFSRNGAPPMSGGYRQQLPGPGMLVRPGSMGPPSQHSPITSAPRHQYPTRSSTFDESLRLPPLQTQIANSSLNGQQRTTDPRALSRESQARSIEAMVMTIPFVQKIRVLTKISPSLAPPGPTSPAHERRGAVVAVEGSDKELLAEIGDYITEYLNKIPSFAVKTWNTSQLPATSRPVVAPASNGDTKMSEVTTTPAPIISIEAYEKDPFIDYFSIISEWHSKSQEITKYITTSPPSPPIDVDAPSTTTPVPKTLPVALIPRGFSLTTSDDFALRIPINDSYAPVDHWQWMATLWRGIVGPDLTIYVNRASRDELNKFSGVEIRGDCATIIVRIPEGAKMDEKTARRLGFEVEEIVRNIESGFGRG